MGYSHNLNQICTHVTLYSLGAEECGLTADTLTRLGDVRKRSFLCLPSPEILVPGPWKASRSLPGSFPPELWIMVRGPCSGGGSSPAGGDHNLLHPLSRTRGLPGRFEAWVKQVFSVPWVGTARKHSPIPRPGTRDRWECFDHYLRSFVWPLHATCALVNTIFGVKVLYSGHRLSVHYDTLVRVDVHEVAWGIVDRSDGRHILLPRQ